MYHLLASARDETLAQRALDLAISDEPSATIASAMVADVAEEHPDLAFDFALAHRDRLKTRVSESMRARFYPGLATTSNDPAMVDRIGPIRDGVDPGGVASNGAHHDGAGRLSRRRRAPAAARDRRLAAGASLSASAQFGRQAEGRAVARERPRRRSSRCRCAWCASPSGGRSSVRSRRCISGLATISSWLA